MPPYRLELCDEEICNSLCYVKGPIIIGAGPSGLAVAACLKSQGIPSLILERYDCIGSLWRYKTYDCIHLHLPKQFCELPLHPIPEHYPTYLGGKQFLEYLDDYCITFKIHPRFNETVYSARYDERSGLWRVYTVPSTGGEVREYAGHWVVVATGENADALVPSIPGLHCGFKGGILHSSLYRNGKPYEGHKVLVVGCGNSGMEIALDLLRSNAFPSLVVRHSVHVLPHTICGVSTYSIIVKLLQVFPLWVADKLLLFCAWCKWRNTASCGLPRPPEGPIAYKTSRRRTPVLDPGTLPLIKAGQIKVFPAVKQFTSTGAIFVNGHAEDFDDVILATGYQSNVTKWLLGENETFDSNGLPKAGASWKGKKGLYIVGLSGMGLSAAANDALSIVEDIKIEYQAYWDPK